MTVASINEETGKTILFGLPRNMTNFPFPQDTELAEAFPQGYDCETCTLNSLATWAADHRSLFAGSETPGIDATIQGIEGITGLKINYYTLVNMDGFKSLVTAMGGLTLNVRDRIPMAAGGRLHRAGRPSAQRLPDAVVRPLPGVRRRLLADGPPEVRDERDAAAAQPQTVLTKFEDLATASTHLIETDLPASEVGEFSQPALKAKGRRSARCPSCLRRSTPRTPTSTRSAP